MKLVRQFHSYSDPERDKRGHTISTVYIADAEGQPVGMDDAAEAGLFSVEDLPSPLAFDHGEIINDYVSGKY